MHNEFQPNGQTWEERATLDGLNSVLDPSNISIKNNLIDIIHKAAIQNVLLKIFSRICRRIVRLRY